MLHLPSSRLFLLAAALFFSGAASMAVEVVWARMLQRTLGSTALAVALILAGFLGGLGLGAFAGERVLPRVRKPLRAYATAELLALLFTLFFTLVLERAELFLRLPAGEMAVLSLVIVAASPWGATFPLVVAALGSGLERSVPIRRAYGVNAIGSAAGGVAAGLLLIRLWGEWGTTLAAVLAEAGAASLALFLSRQATEGSAQPEGNGKLAASARLTEAASFAFFTGLVVLYWEVLWTRLLVLTVAPTIYSFSLISSFVVLGVGMGSFVFGGKLLPRHGGWLLPLSVTGILYAGYFLVPFLPDAYLVGVRTFHAAPLLWGSLAAASLVFVPNFLLGSLFPWMVSRLSSRAGTLYAASSLGSILGAMVAGPCSAAMLSLESSYRLGIALCLSLALLGMASFSAPPAASQPQIGRIPRAMGLLAVLTLFLSLTFFFLGWKHGPTGGDWDPRRLASGVYQWSRDDLESLPLEESFRAREILVVLRGKEVIVSVELDRAANTVYVRGNGKVEGSVPADVSRPSLADLPTQILLGELPAELFQKKPAASALLVGLGSGVTLGALLGEGGKGFLPEKVDVIEIEKAFLDAMGPESVRRYLEPFVPQAVLDGAREERGAQSHESKGVRFHFGDARRLLACELSDRRWDAIVSQPSEPWIPGAAPLFTVEFFEAARRHLEPGGIFFQWLQMYKIEDDGIRLLIRTFHRVFPEVFCLRPPGTGELVLVGCSSTPPLELFLGPAVGPSSAAAGLELPVDRLAIFLGGSRGIASWAGYSPNLPINTDSRSELQFLSTWSLYGGVDLARRNLALLQKTAGEDPVVNYLPAPWRSDSSFRRTLASRNIRLGDFAEALAILDGDDSKEAQEIRLQIPKY